MARTFTEIDKNYLFPDCSIIDSDNLEENFYRFKGSKTDPSEFDYHQLLSRDIYIGHQRTSLKPSVSFTLKRSRDQVQMHFALKGYFEFRYKNKMIASFNPSEHNILILPEESVDVKINKDQDVEYVEILLSKRFVERYISHNNILYNKISATAPVSLSHINMAISPQIQGALHELLRCEFEGHLKSLYIQAKVIELLSLQLAQYEKTERLSQTGLKSADIDKMNTVRALITSSPEKTYSLSYLARAAGTNEQYLKSHFKLIYGKTVFNYLTSYRMERAKELLMAGEKKVSDIGMEVGYKHSTHFTKAFKKYFGYLPLKIKGTLSTFLFGSSHFAFEADILPLYSLFTF